MEHSIVPMACEVLGADYLKLNVSELSTVGETNGLWMDHSSLRPEAIDILYHSMIFFMISTPNRSILLQSQLVQYSSRLFQVYHVRSLILSGVNGSIVALHEFGIAELLYVLS